MQLHLNSIKSINLNALDSVNIDCNTVIVQSGKLYLGSKNATEPLLLGNSTISTLNNLIDNYEKYKGRKTYIIYPYH